MPRPACNSQNGVVTPGQFLGGSFLDYQEGFPKVFMRQLLVIMLLALLFSVLVASRTYSSSFREATEEIEEKMSHAS